MLSFTLCERGQLLLGNGYKASTLSALNCRDPLLPALAGSTHRDIPLPVRGKKEPRGLLVALIYYVLCKSTAVSGLSAALSGALYPELSAGCAL